MTWKFEYIANAFRYIEGGCVKRLDKRLIIENQNPYLEKYKTQKPMQSLRRVW